MWLTFIFNATHINPLHTTKLVETKVFAHTPKQTRVKVKRAI